LGFRVRVRVRVRIRVRASARIRVRVRVSFISCSRIEDTAAWSSIEPSRPFFPLRKPPIRVSVRVRVKRSKLGLDF